MMIWRADSRWLRK